MLVDKPIALEDFQKDSDARARLDEMFTTIEGLYRSMGAHGVLSVSINGAWGTGKSSYLQALGERFKERGSAVVGFEAWRYAHEPDIFLALLEEIYHLPCLSTPTKRQLRSVIKSLGVAALVGADAYLKATLKVGLKEIKESFQLIEKRVEAEVTRTRKASEKLRNVIQKIKEEHDNKPFILLIDDLDRLLPETAVALLEKLRFYFDGDGVIVVMAINDEVINSYVHEKHGLEKERLSEAFLDKIFQYRFDLSSVELGKLHFRGFSGAVEGKKDDIARLLGARIRVRLPHRKWINLLNRIEVEFNSRQPDDTALEPMLTLIVARELFPEFNYAYRHDQSILVEQNSRALQRCKEEIEKKNLHDITLFESLIGGRHEEEQL
jgi:hypothetical protein